MNSTDELIETVFGGRYKHTICFSVPGEPQGKGRPRFSRFGNTYTPTKTRNYEARVKACALEELERRNMALKPAGANPVMVAMVARYEIPKSVLKNKAETARRLSGEKAPGKPDTDNISKVKDALNGVLWNDDKQVMLDLVVKEYTPGEPELMIFVAWGKTEG